MFICTHSYFCPQVCKGIQEREEMLVVGTSLMGIGEIFMNDGKLYLRPPQSEGQKYFLTKLTKNQLVKQLRSQGNTIRIFAFIFGGLAAGLLIFVIYKVAKQYLEKRKKRQDFEAILQASLRRRAQARDDNRNITQDDTCVICLTNPREVITLECGHIAMCSDCAQALPSPNTCPVCRESIERFLPVYRP